MENVGERVKRLREVMNWTQEQLAQQIPVSLSTVQRWESGGPLRSLSVRRELERLFSNAGVAEEAFAKDGEADAGTEDEQ